MRSWKLRTQPSLGFALVLLLTVIVGGAGLLSLRNVIDSMAISRQINGDQAKFSEAVTTRGIAANISHASSGVRDVNDNVNQSSTTAGEIPREIPTESKRTSDIMQSSAQVKSSSDTLHALAKGLNRIVARFKY